MQVRDVACGSREMKLHKAIVYSTIPSNNQNPHLEGLILENVRIKNQGARVYSTYIQAAQGDEQDFVLIAMLKDYHLAFGQMSSFGQYCFARFLEHEFVENSCTRMLLYIPREDGEMRKMHVTRTKESPDGAIAFTFTPAN